MENPNNKKRKNKSSKKESSSPINVHLEGKLDETLSKPFTFDRVIRILLGISIAIALYLLFDRLSNVLLPFLIAWLIAYLLYPIMHFFETKCRISHRIASITLTLVSVVSFFILILTLIIPPIVNEVLEAKDVVFTLTKHLETTSFLTETTKNQLIEWFNHLNLTEILTGATTKENLLEKILPYFGKFLSSSMNFIAGLLVVFITILYLIFILWDYEHIAKNCITLVPHKYQNLIILIAEDLKSGMNKYFRGQLVIASIAGLLLSIGFYFIDLPLGIILGLSMGILTLVPYLKTIMLPVVLLFAFIGAQQSGLNWWIMGLESLAVMGIVQIIEDLFLIPKIMGNAMGLNPAVILLSLSIWGSLFGIAGMIVALPLTTILLSYYTKVIKNV
ncbi:MAG: AI-2E family transporter [Paludibacteraceae bacterium]|nr:AI-2E family transporter [Paludibacteraceae bacterium]